MAFPLNQWLTARSCRALIAGIGTTVAMFLATELAFVGLSIGRIDKIASPTWVHGAVYFTAPYLLCGLLFWPVLAKTLHLLVHRALIAIGTFCAIGYALGTIFSLYGTFGDLTTDLKMEIVGGRLLLAIAFPVWCVGIDRLGNELRE